MMKNDSQTNEHTIVPVEGDVAGARVNLKRLDHHDLEQFAVEAGAKPFRGRQLFKWIYGKKVTAFDSMTDLSLDFRHFLKENASIGSITLTSRQIARDRTIKCLFRLESGRHVESVLIPDFDDNGKASRLTVCVSSQVGCAMGCTFCATGMMGFKQNLMAGEIFDQVAYLDELAEERFGRGITNVVYMGMGEPLLNYDNVLKSINTLTHPDGMGLSPRRITVSTVGLARRLRQLADDRTRFNLAVSLHAPTEEKRSSIMPVNRAAKTDLAALKEAIQYYFQHTKRPVTYEYCMFEGFNDTESDAKALSRIANWVPAKVNLIMYNTVEGVPFRRSGEDRVHSFIQTLVAREVRVTVRRSRGADIDAACGQLALEES